MGSFLRMNSHMAKLKSRYVCESCGAISAKWFGKCGECNSWNTLTEEVIATKTQPKRTYTHQRQKSVALPLSSISELSVAGRIPLPSQELNRVFGGGLTESSVTLLTGNPGIGKSTLLLQMLGELAAKKHKALYISGEEAAHQIADRATRLGIPSDDLLVLCENNIESIMEEIKDKNPDIIVFDSIQTLLDPKIQSIPGSVTQVKEVADQVVRMAKENNKTCIIVGHVTKEGNIAGPMLLEHLVDTVLKFEGDSALDYRILRVIKNRFGPTHEIGVLEMTGTGLLPVSNPSKYFLNVGSVATPGTSVFPHIEGSRTFLVEVQALVSKSSFAVPVRNAVGFEKNRLTMLLAVLEKHVDISFGELDVFVNMVGGLKVKDPGADLAVILSILSSVMETPLPEGSIVMGEVGLTGEIRQPMKADIRANEAVRLGFSIVLGKLSLDIKKIQRRHLDHVKQTMAILR